MEVIPKQFNAFVIELNNSLTKKDFEISEVNGILDKLNSLDYTMINLGTEDVEEIIRNCAMIPPNNSLLVAKSSNFLLNVIKRNATLNDVHVSLLVHWIGESLNECADIAYVDLLQLVEALVQTNYLNHGKESARLFNILCKKLEQATSVSNPNDIKLLRIGCLKSLDTILSEEYHLQLAEEYLDILRSQDPSNLSHHSQIWMVTLEALDSLCAKSTKWLEVLLGEVIGIILYGVELGLNGKLPAELKSVHPSAISLPPYQNSVETNKVNLKVKKKPKSKLKQVGWTEKQVVNVGIVELGEESVDHFNTSWITSDSDVSDNEGNPLAGIGKTQAKTRHCAFNLLIQMIKVLGCKVLYEYYNVILGKLVMCVKNEKLSKPKVASMAAITALLTGAKPFLAQAQHSEGGAFTTFSEILSELVTGLHSTLGGLLNTIPHMSVVIPLLHTTAALISVTPYHRLRPALLSNLFKAIHIYVHHKDPTVIVGVLHCLAEIVILNPVSVEQKDIILYGLKGSASGTISPPDCWLLSYCFNILKEQCSSDVRVACWQILGGLCQCHFDRIIPSLTILETYIFQDLKAPNKPMIYAAKTLEHLLLKLLPRDEFDTYKRTLWINLLEGPFVILIDNSRRAAAIACDCLSNIGPQIFNNLKEDKQILIITLLYGCCYSDVVVVRGSAVNTLGVFLLFPQLIHEQFVLDTKDILMKSLADESDYVRTKAAWAFGNLVDVLRENQSKDFVYDIPILKLLEAALQVSKDSNRVKANILRAVGNLLLLITEDHLKNVECEELIYRAINFCVGSSSTGNPMKMRWNACFAIGTFLQNDVLCRISSQTVENVVNNLCKLVIKCDNFKVRANASTALCSIKKRTYFGDYYLYAWRSLLDGLDNAANMSDFKEFKHQDYLIQQLCCAICHLASILELADISELNEVMRYRMDSIKEQMVQFQNSAPPEKSGNLLAALNNLNVLLKMELELNDRKFLSCIQNVFIIV